jgi:ThiF family
MNDWLEEHIRTLTQMSGLTADEARRLFHQNLSISIDPALRENRTYRLAFAYAVNLLCRLFPTTRFDALDDEPLLILPWAGTSPLPADEHSASVLLVFGKRPSLQTADKVITANCHDWQVCIDCPWEPDPKEDWNPVLALATACYAAARVSKVLLGDAVDGPLVWRPFSILDFRNGSLRFDWSEPLAIGDLYLAGVGAVGSAVLYSMAAHRAACGNLYLVDREELDRGNLGRYSFFDTNDETQNKSVAAKRRLDQLGLRLKVMAIPKRFEQFYDEQHARTRQFGVPRLLSAPDRRDTRRQFQSRLPKEIWDASTGPDQVVLHHNAFDPKLACLACIYPEQPHEHAHWKHVAEMLDVPLDRILSGEPITEHDAGRIIGKYAHLTRGEVVGKAFDSVFRQLCSAGSLRSSDRAVLSPFSFISGLAGVLLYFELVKSLCPSVFGDYHQYNYTQLNPFFPPNPEFRELRGSRPSCFCQQDAVRKVYLRIWAS